MTRSYTTGHGIPPDTSGSGIKTRNGRNGAADDCYNETTHVITRRGVLDLRVRPMRRRSVRSKSERRPCSRRPRNDRTREKRIDAVGGHARARRQLARGRDVRARTSETGATDGDLGNVRRDRVPKNPSARHCDVPYRAAALRRVLGRKVAQRHGRGPRLKTFAPTVSRVACTHRGVYYTHRSRAVRGRTSESRELSVVINIMVKRFIRGESRKRRTLVVIKLTCIFNLHGYGSGTRSCECD